MKSLTRSLAVLAVVLLAAVLSNPSAEHHRDTIKAHIGERSNLERLLGVGQITSFFSTYHNLGVASYCTLNQQVVSYGLFGMVFVND